MDFIAPLKDSDDGASIEAMLSSSWIKRQAEISKWVPFAGDALGNIFFCTVKGTIIFLDHESGEVFEFIRKEN